MGEEINTENASGPYRWYFVDDNDMEFIEMVKLFVTSVNWSEWWLIGLLTTHLVTFLLILWKRKSTDFKFVLFVILLLGVYMAEPLNDYAAEHWKEFATQPYFNKSGSFISIVYSAPMLINCIIILILVVIEMSQLLVKVKRAEIRQKQRESKKTN